MLRVDYFADVEPIHIKNHNSTKGFLNPIIFKFPNLKSEPFKILPFCLYIASSTNVYLLVLVLSFDIMTFTLRSLLDEPPR